jgi:hypothetical protein
MWYSNILILKRDLLSRQAPYLFKREKRRKYNMTKLLTPAQKYVSVIHSNYVYLKAENYVENNKRAAESAFLTGKDNVLRASQALQKKYSASDLKNLAKYYNKHKKIISAVGAANQTNGNAYQRAILDALSEKFQFDVSQAFDFNFDTGAVRAKKGGHIVDRVSVLRDEAGAMSFLSTVKNKLENLLKILDQSGAKLQTQNGKFIFTKTDLQSYQTDEEKLTYSLSALAKAFEAYITKVNKSSKANVVTLKKLFETMGIHFKLLDTWTKISRRGNKVDRTSAVVFTKAINAIIATYSSGLLPSMIGAFQEYIWHGIEAVADGVAEESIDKHIKTSLSSGGGKVVEGKVILKNMDADILAEIEEGLKKKIEYGDYENGRASLEIKFSSQQKMDILVTTETKEYPISIKNYKSNKAGIANITLQSGGPLMTYLFGANNANESITKHYLNMLAEHDDSAAAEFKGLKNLGLKVLALQIAYQSLTGDWYGKLQGQADILAWTDSSTGETMFYNMGDLIEDVFKSTFNGDSILKITPNLNSIQLKNKAINPNHVWGRTDAEKVIMDIKSRVAQAILDAHTKKLHVTMRLQNFSKMK